MARFGRITKLALVTLGVAAFGTAVVAQDKAQVVKDRVAAMKKMGADNKALNDYSKGMGSKDDALKAIADLQALNPKISSWFVAGTSSADMPGVSYAKPTIWTEKAKFDAIIGDLKTAEAATAEAVKNGTPEAVGATLPPIGRTGCGACHTTYREKLPT